MHWYFLQEMHFLVILFTELLRLIQLEPLNLETLFKLCCVGLERDTSAMYFFIFLYFILFKTNTNVPLDLHWTIMTS